MPQTQQHDIVLLVDSSELETLAAEEDTIRDTIRSMILDGAGDAEMRTEFAAYHHAAECEDGYLVLAEQHAEHRNKEFAETFSRTAAKACQLKLLHLRNLRDYLPF